MRISSIIWRGIAIILLCIMLQACSKEQAAEKDRQQQLDNNQDISDSVEGQHKSNVMDSADQQSVQDATNVVDEQRDKDGTDVSVDDDPAGNSGAALTDPSSTEAANTEGAADVDSKQHEEDPSRQHAEDPSSNPANEQTIPPKAYELPEGFVYLDDVLPNAQYELRYYSEYNFVGRQIEGYKAPYAIATEEMAEALAKVSNEMEAAGYRLLIYDTYRPAKAVEFFKAWSADHEDTEMKDVFYPNEDKSQLFKRGYLSKKSGHSRGSTVDLTLVEADTGELVDMGSPYDLLDEISYFNTTLITTEQAANRELLKQVMNKYGFKEYSKEWWHYVLRNEPYPTTYFDFDVQ